VRRVSFLLSFPCLTFSYTFCPSSHHPVCPPYFLLFLPAASLASLSFINFQFHFNLVVGSLLSPLDPCNTPSPSTLTDLNQLNWCASCPHTLKTAQFVVVATLDAQHALQKTHVSHLQVTRWSWQSNRECSWWFWTCLSSLGCWPHPQELPSSHAAASILKICACKWNLLK